MPRRIVAFLRSLFSRSATDSHRYPDSDGADSDDSDDSQATYRTANTHPSDPARRASQGQQFLADMHDELVLVYRYRDPVGLQVMKHGDLVEVLKTDPMLRLTRKPIPRNTWAVTLYQRDLAPESNGHPNADQNVAHVRFGLRNYVRYVLGKKAAELHILSRREGKPAVE